MLACSKGQDSNQTLHCIFLLLSTQVRPPLTIAICALDACLSTCLYTKFQTAGSAGVALFIACAWNLASVLLRLALDMHSRRSFLRTNSRSISRHTRDHQVWAGRADKVKSQ